MPIFQMQSQKLLPIREKDIDLEKNIQKLTEVNLATVFELQFVCTEFALQNFRIDTLAFDEEAKAFVIIEYKRDRSFTVIDQGFAYLALMLNNKADFILEYNEKTKKNLKREDVDWSQSRVLFLAQSFTTYQQNAINFRDLPIELWEVKIFDNSTILYNQLISSDTKESIKTITKNKTIENVSREVTVFTLEDHLNVNENTKNLFFALREKVLALGGDIEERPKKQYIAYGSRPTFLYTHIQQSQIKLHIIIHKSKLTDPKGIARDVTNIGHFGGGATEIILDKVEDLPYIMTMVEQSYSASKK
jgi:predicted transport protein